MILFLSILCFLLFLLCIFLFSLVLIGARIVKEYEDFFQDTIEDISGTINMLDNLMQRHVMSDDTDVQNLYRVMQITHDILVGYINARSNRTNRKEKGKK